MNLLRRKIEQYLVDWKIQEDRLPLIVKGARQVGKTASIMQFASDNYKNVVAINFVLQQKYKAIFEEGYEVDDIVRNMTLINPNLTFEPHNTLIFFDEMQDCPACATSLKGVTCKSVWLCINSCEPKKKELSVNNTSQLCSKLLNFSIKRFCCSIS